MFDADDNYIFNPDELHSPNEDERSWAIIHISKSRLEEYESTLLNLLATETSYNNRRHIVRALEKIL